jgi:hypothetical protein
VCEQSSAGVFDPGHVLDQLYPVQADPTLGSSSTRCAGSSASAGRYPDGRRWPRTKRHDDKTLALLIGTPMNHAAATPGADEVQAAVSRIDGQIVTK